MVNCQTVRDYLNAETPESEEAENQAASHLGECANCREYAETANRDLKKKLAPFAASLRTFFSTN